MQQLLVNMYKFWPTKKKKMKQEIYKQNRLLIIFHYSAVCESNLDSSPSHNTKPMAFESCLFVVSSGVLTQNLQEMTLK